MSNLITDQNEWTPALLDAFYGEIETIAIEELKLDTYPNQIEIISSEQMLDAYSSIGLPIFYTHWSFGKHFVSQADQYRRGNMGLAYEIVINSNPCIAYCMENNNMMMQALVMAHASFGHNAFFKNNYLFKEWTNADTIIDYLVFAKKYINDCENLYGSAEVEQVLDAAHALQNYGSDRYKRPARKTKVESERERKARNEFIQSNLNDLWRTIPKDRQKDTFKYDDVDRTTRYPQDPQENILYFIEKNAPTLDIWKREIIRIVRKLSQYFYPQRQTQLMNEGFATFTHYTIMQRLHDKGLISDGYMLEFLHSHTSVTLQPEFDKPYYNGINPYALGFAMYVDIKRIVEDPTDEDRDWFAEQDWIGCGDAVKTINWAAANFKDESFVRQFISPKVIRDFKLFSIMDDDRDPELEVSAIHNKAGFKDIRDKLADQYLLANNEPNIQVYEVDVNGDRSLSLRHYQHNRRPLELETAEEVLKHVRVLWEFDVRLESVDGDKNVTSRLEISNDEEMLDVFVDDSSN